MGQLDGVLVLDLSRLLPGPYMTMVLADMGARVIKVEAPAGGDYLRGIPPWIDGVGARFRAVNRNKESIVLDLKSESGPELLLGLCERADVVVESFRPGVMEGLGLGYSVLRERKSSLILCSISGYGQTGPHRRRAGHDLNYQALSGALAMGGQRDGLPAVPGIQAADFAGGSLWGLAGVLGALYHRERTGEGTHLDISMTEGALALLSAELATVRAGDKPGRGRGTLSGGLACYRSYPCRDGRYLAVAALEPKFYEALNRALGRAFDAAELLAGAVVQDQIAREFATIFATRTRDQWVEHLAEVDCCVEPVLELDELHQSELLAERGVFSEDGVAVKTPLAPIRESRPAPKHGEHTDAVLAEFGLA